jgi:hypothetical protein
VYSVRRWEQEPPGRVYGLIGWFVVLILVGFWLTCISWVTADDRELRVGTVGVARRYEWARVESAQVFLWGNLRRWRNRVLFRSVIVEVIVDDDGFTHESGGIC